MRTYCKKAPYAATFFRKPQLKCKFSHVQPPRKTWKRGLVPAKVEVQKGNECQGQGIEGQHEEGVPQLERTSPGANDAQGQHRDHDDGYL
jgi:hypothetical protein